MATLKGMWSSTGVMRLSVSATLALALSCGAGNKYKAPPMPPRVEDGAPDKRAAMRSAAPHELELEVEHERWNYEAAAQVKEVEEANKAAAAKPAPPPAKSVGVMGPAGATTQPGASAKPDASAKPGATPQPPPAAAPAPVK